MKITKQIRYSVRAANNKSASACRSRKEISGQKRRLIRLAQMSGVLVIMNVLATSFINDSLEDFQASSEKLLRCRLAGVESKNWEDYDLPKEGGTVCSREEITRTFHHTQPTECTSSCYVRTSHEEGSGWLDYLEKIGSTNVHNEFKTFCDGTPELDYYRSFTYFPCE